MQATLERLAARETPLTAALPRTPGSREVRWMHLLGAPGTHPPQQPEAQRDLPGRTALEERVRVLEERLNQLEAKFAESLNPHAESS